MGDVPDQVKVLHANLVGPLEAIQPSLDRPALGAQIRLWPCDVTLHDGRQVQHVYLVDAREYIRTWGVWPWEDRGKAWLPVESIASIRESADRLPVRLANQLYASGESGMGYCCFAIHMRSGRTLYVVTGNTVDFIAWPRGTEPADAVAVVPHARTERGSVAGCPYSWSPFRRG